MDADSGATMHPDTKASLNENQAEMERLQGENLNLKLRVQYLEDLLGEGKENAPSYWDIQSYLSKEHGRMLDEAAMEIKQRDEEIANMKRWLEEIDASKRQLETQHAQQNQELSKMRAREEELQEQIKEKDAEMLRFRDEMKAWTRNEVDQAERRAESNVEELNQGFEVERKQSQQSHLAELQDLRELLQAEHDAKSRELQKLAETELMRVKEEERCKAEDETRREVERELMFAKDAADREKDSLTTTLQRCQLELRRAEEERDALKTTLRQRAEEADELAVRVRQGEQRAERLEEEAQRGRKEATSNVEAMSEMLKRAEKTATDEESGGGTEEEIEAMRDRKGGESRDLERVKEELAFTTKREEDARKHAEDLEEGWRRSQTDLTVCQDRLQEVIIKLADAEAKAAEMTKAAGEAKEQAREQASQTHTLQAQVGQLARSLSVADEMRARAAQELEEERERSRTQQQDVASLTTELHSAEQRLRRSRDEGVEQQQLLQHEIQALSTRLRECEREAGEGRTRGRAEESKNREKTEEMARMEGRMSQMERELACEQERVVELEEKRREDREKLQRMQERLQRQASLSSQLQEQNEHFSARMAEGTGRAKGDGEPLAGDEKGEEMRKLTRENFELRRDMEALQGKLAEAQESAQEALRLETWLKESQNRARDLQREEAEAKAERDEARKAAQGMQQLLEGVSKQTSNLQVLSEEERARLVADSQRADKARRDLERDLREARKEMENEKLRAERAQEERDEVEGIARKLRDKLADADKVAIAAQRRVMELEGNLEKLSLSLPLGRPSASVPVQEVDIHKLRECNRVLILELEETRLRLLEERHRRHKAEAATASSHPCLPLPATSISVHPAQDLTAPLPRSASRADGRRIRQPPRPGPPGLSTSSMPPSPPSPPKLSALASPMPSQPQRSHALSPSPSPSPAPWRSARLDSSVMHLSRTAVRHLSEQPRDAEQQDPQTPVVEDAASGSRAITAASAAYPSPPSPSPYWPSPGQSGADADASAMALSDRGARQVSIPPTSLNASGAVLYPMKSGVDESTEGRRSGVDIDFGASPAVTNGRSLRHDGDLSVSTIALSRSGVRQASEPPDSMLGDRAGHYGKSSSWDSKVAGVGSKSDIGSLNGVSSKSMASASFSKSAGKSRGALSNLPLTSGRVNSDALW